MHMHGVVIHILIVENCLAHNRTQNAVLCASNYVYAQWKNKRVIYVDMPYLFCTNITPTTQWITAFTRMQDEAFFLKFGAKMCAVILNSRMKCPTSPRQTRSLWTGPCRAKQRSASPKHHTWRVLLWDIKQHAAIIHYRHFGTTYWPHLKGQEI
jgi:hypothetical protein